MGFLGIKVIFPIAFKIWFVLQAKLPGTHLLHKLRYLCNNAPPNIKQHFSESHEGKLPTKHKSQNTTASEVNRRMQKWDYVQCRHWPHAEMGKQSLLKSQIKALLQK
jgi:hypothetical protein